MIGIGTKKKLPNPSTNTTPSVKQDYLSSALGLPATEQAEGYPNKKKPRTDAGGQLSRGSLRGA